MLPDNSLRVIDFGNAELEISEPDIFKYGMSSITAVRNASGRQQGLRHDHVAATMFAVTHMTWRHTAGWT